MSRYPRAVPPHRSTPLQIVCSYSGGPMGRYHLEAFDGDRPVHSAHYSWNVWHGHASGQLLMPEFLAAAERQAGKAPTAQLRVQGLEAEAFAIADVAMVSMLVCTSLPDDAVRRGEAGEVDLVDEHSRPARTVQEADPGAEDALRWLCARGLAEIRRRVDGVEYAFLHAVPEGSDV